MANRAISRVLLVFALIVAAHALKPISSRSVIEQLLSAAESLSFVLPDFAEVRIAQASYLAAAFGQRSEGDSRLSQDMVAVTIPEVLGFGQSTTPNRAVATCGRTEVAPAMAKARPVRAFVARTQARMKVQIQELPEAMPLSQALAMTIPLADVELRLLRIPRLSERQFLRRPIFMPASLRPILPARKLTRTECEATLIATQSEAELSQNEGPKEEEFELQMWEMDEPAEAMEDAKTEPANDEGLRNCQVTVPEVVMPPLPLEITPKQ